MPRIDPKQLLVCLTPLLAPNGGIKSTSEVIRLANLMEKYSKKLVSKCIYISILKCSEMALLDNFMAVSGWNLVFNWLRDGSDSENWPFVQELLEMLLLCPVDGNRLKSNHTPRIVKALSVSCPHPHVKLLSKKLVEQWLKIAHQEKQQLNSGLNGTTAEVKVEESQVLNETKVNEINETNGQESEIKSEDDTSKKQSKENIKYKVSNKEGSGKLLLSLKRSTSPSADEKDSKVSKSDSKSKSSSSDKDKKKSSSSSSSHKSSSSSSKSSRDKDRNSSSSSSSHHKSSRSSSKDKQSSSSKSSSSKHSSTTTRSSSRDKDKDREKRKKESSEKSQAEKDKETLDLLAPLSSTRLQRIPKRQHSENGENKSLESNKDEPSPSKVAKTTEVVEKKKPSISIEVRKGEKPKTVKTLNSQFRNHGLAEEPPKPPSRKDIKKPGALTAVLPTSLPSSTPVVKISTSPPPSKKIQLDKALETDVPERVGGVKLIKPKPMLVESIGFMDALSATTTKKDSKKRKRLPSNGKKDELESPKVETKPLKFYKDTFEEAEEEQTNGEKSPTKDLESREGSKEADTKVDATETVEKADAPSSSESKTEKSPEVEELDEKRPPGIGCGPDGPPCALVSPNMPRRKKRPIRWRSDEELTDIRYFELDETERTNVTKTFTEKKQMEHDGERSAFKSRQIQSEDTMAEQTTWRTLIIVDNVPPLPGCKSQEVEIQAERERNVLQDIFFGHSITDSPHEPGNESYEHVEPQIVPLDDVTGNPDSVTNFTDIQWPAPKGDLPSAFSSNAFANVFSNINIPPAVVNIPPAVGINSVNPLANFPLAGISNQIRDPLNPSMWMMAPPAFMQPPPIMMGNQAPNRPNNNYRSNNNNSNNNNNRNNNNGNWVRGNTRRGVCNQFQRNGHCRNRKNCPYIHER